MQIIIEYSSCWQAKLLKGNNDRDWFNKERNPIQKGAALGDKFPKEAPISSDTVLGICYRIVGDQRKLWQILEKEEYLLIKNDISFKINNEIITKEIAALKYAGNVENPAGYRGASRKEINLLFADENRYQYLCSPLVCTPSELYNLVINENFIKSNIKLKSRLDFLKLSANINNDVFCQSLSIQQRTSMLDKFKKLFPKARYDAKDVERYLVFCLSAMYMCAQYLNKVYPYKEPKGKEWKKGISHRTITPKEVIAAVAEKNTVINYPTTESRKSQNLQKSDGHLIINIDVDERRAKEIEQLILNANVGCFSVGKKGLAYLRSIDTKRERVK